MTCPRMVPISESTAVPCGPDEFCAKDSGAMARAVKQASSKEAGFAEFMGLGAVRRKMRQQSFARVPGGHAAVSERTRVNKSGEGASRCGVEGIYATRADKAGVPPGPRILPLADFPHRLPLTQAGRAFPPCRRPS